MFATAHSRAVSFIAAYVCAAALLCVAAPSQSTAELIETQSLQPAQSVMRFSIETAVATMAGRFTRYSGKLSVSPQTRTISKLSLDLRISEVAIDPSQGFEFLSPEALFRTLPNPTLRYVSETITALGSNRFRADGTLTQGSKRWKAAVPFTASFADRRGTTLQFKLNARLSELETPMPLAMNPQRDRGSLEGRLYFSPSQARK